MPIPSQGFCLSVCRLLFLNSCSLVGGDRCVPQHTHRGQRTTPGSQFPPPVMWVLGCQAWWRVPISLSSQSLLTCSSQGLALEIHWRLDPLTTKTWLPAEVLFLPSTLFSSLRPSAFCIGSWGGSRRTFGARRSDLCLGYAVVRPRNSLECP